MLEYTLEKAPGYNSITYYSVENQWEKSIQFARKV